jgi:CRISPR-associated protein Cmr3
VNTYLLEPHDPLLVRDGRPFTAGGHAQTLPFVLPPTLSGFVRSVQGSESGTFDPARIPELRGLQTLGPVLRGPDGALYLPAPRDAVRFKDGDEHTLLPLTPTALPEGALMDTLSEQLLPLTLPGNPKGKPAAGDPFWHWSSFQAWLQGTLTQSPQSLKLELDERLHVSLNPATGTALDGALFGTRSLDFQQADGQPLSLMFRTTATLRPGAYPFGGERRLSLLKAADDAFPGCPDDICEAVVRTGRVRLVLLTPAMFGQGWRPQRLLTDSIGVTLRAAATGRAVTVSGWDFAKRQAKPTRRLVPEGSVYFLELGGDEAARRAWVNRHWFACVSDDHQDCLDGLGLAALGLWRQDD